MAASGSRCTLTLKMTHSLDMATHSQAAPPVTHHHQTAPSQPPNAPRLPSASTDATNVPEQFVTGLTGFRAAADSSARPGRFQRIPNILPLPVTHTQCQASSLVQQWRLDEKGGFLPKRGIFSPRRHFVGKMAAPFVKSEWGRPSWKTCPKATPPQPARGLAHAQ